MTAVMLAELGRAGAQLAQQWAHWACRCGAVARRQKRRAAPAERATSATANTRTARHIKQVIHSTRRNPMDIGFGGAP